MTLWLLLTGFLFVLALLAESANLLGPQMFAVMGRDGALKDEISQLQRDLAQIEKKFDAAKAATAKSITEIEKLRKEASRLERELDDRRAVVPVLVYRIAQSSATLIRFRAPISKTLPAETDSQQALIWRAPGVIETWSLSPDQAAVQAQHHFRRELGYTVGTFVRPDEPGGTPS
jgi:hypothetical protein